MAVSLSASGRLGPKLMHELEEERQGNGCLTCAAQAVGDALSTPISVGLIQNSRGGGSGGASCVIFIPVVRVLTMAVGIPDSVPHSAGWRQRI